MEILLTEVKNDVVAASSIVLVIFIGIAIFSLALEIVMIVKYPHYSISGKVRHGKISGYPIPSKDYRMFGGRDGSDDDNSSSDDNLPPMTDRVIMTVPDDNVQELKEENVDQKIL